MKGQSRANCLKKLSGSAERQNGAIRPLQRKNGEQNAAGEQNGREQNGREQNGACRTVPSVRLKVDEHCEELAGFGLLSVAGFDWQFRFGTVKWHGQIGGMCWRRVRLRSGGTGCSVFGVQFSANRSVQFAVCSLQCSESRKEGDSQKVAAAQDWPAEARIEQGLSLDETW